MHHLSSVFLAEVLAAGLSRDSTVYEVEPVVIRPKGAAVWCPIDMRLGCAYVDAIHGEDHVENATHMLSYAWFYSVGDIVDALEKFCADSSLCTRRTYVWICSLCVNQHRVKEKQNASEVVPFEQFSKQFRERVTGIGNVLALMAPWESPKYFTRVWCIFELFTAISLGKDEVKVTIVMPPRETTRFCNALLEEGTDVSKVWSALTSVDVKRADSSVKNDLESIRRLIEKGPGYKAVNAAVAKYLTGWFADASERHLRDIRASGSFDAEAISVMFAQVGRLLRTVGLYDRASAVLQEGLELVSETDAQDGTAHARLLVEIGVVEKKRGHLKAALEAFERARRARERTDTLNTPLGARLMNNIGSAKEACSDFKGALEAFLETKKILECVGGMCSRDGAQLLRNMGTIKEEEGDPSAALVAYCDAQDILQAAGLLQTPDGARIVNNIGHAKHQSGDLLGARQAFDEARAIRERTGTMDTPAGAELLSNLARLLEDSGESEAAREADGQAMLIYKKSGTKQRPQLHRSAQKSLLRMTTE